MMVSMEQSDTAMDTSCPSLRPMTAELSLLSQPDGSSMHNQGDTTVMAAVYGPRDVRMRKELIDRATVDVIYKPKTGLPGCSHRFNEQIVKNTCETMIIGKQHPRTSIDIIIQEMQDSGSFLSCAINGACLALLDACVPLHYTVAALECIIDSEGEIVMDPTKKQSQDARAQMLFVLDSVEKGIISSSAKGCYTSQEYHQCLLACQQASADIFTYYREAITKKVSKGI